MLLYYFIYYTRSLISSLVTYIENKKGSAKALDMLVLLEYIRKHSS